MSSWRSAAARAYGESYTGTPNISARCRATAATRAPQSVTWGSPGVCRSASMRSQARSMRRSFKGPGSGPVAVFAGLGLGTPWHGALLGERGLVLLHEVGGGLHERTA